MHPFRTPPASSTADRRSPRCSSSPASARCSAWAASSSCRSTRRCARSALKHFLINDERCGAFAADAYARVTNRPGVCDATLGPGATNLVTALVESLNAGMPMIAIVGDANRDHAWKNMTQEARQVEILRPAVKEVIRVEVTKRIPGAGAARLRGRDERAARPGGARRAGGRLPRRARFRRGGFLGRRGDAEGAGAPHASRSAGARARRGADREGRAAADAGRRRHPHLGRLRRAAGARRRLRHSGRAHDVRQGRDRLHASALGRPVRPLLAHRQRPGRARPTPDRRRLQARRDRDEALPADPARQADDPHRHPRRGDRPHHAHRRRARGRCAARAAGSRGRAVRRRQGAREARALLRRSARSAWPSGARARRIA